MGINVHTNRTGTGESNHSRRAQETEKRKKILGRRDLDTSILLALSQVVHLCWDHHLPHPGMVTQGDRISDDNHGMNATEDEIDTGPQ